MDELEELLPEDQGGGAESDRTTQDFLEEALLARRTGDFEGALDAYALALATEPGNVEALLGRTAMERALGRPRDALRTCLDLLDNDPDYAAARVELAEVLRALGCTADAMAIHAVLLRESGHSPMAWYALGHLLIEERCDAAAAACLARAIALDGSHAAARLELARLILGGGDPLGAIEAFHDAIAVAPEDAAPQAGLAEALMALGRLPEAADRLERALALDEESVEARLARARLRESQGDLAGAAEDLAYRWHLAANRRPKLPGEPWEGGSVDGLTILLYDEGDARDTLRLVRYAPLLAADGATVVVLAEPALLPLLDGQDGIARVLAADEPLPDDLGIDVTAALVDLPGLRAITLETIPARLPYLAYPPGRRRRVVVPPGIRLKVGLSWGSALPFAALLPLADVEGVALFALEGGAAALAAAAEVHPALVTDLGATAADLADTAGRIAEMDLVVAGDTAIAHLAAAMGKPVWLLLPRAAAPCWLEGRADSPWYPGLRLLRGADWEGAVAGAHALLVELALEAAERDASRLRQSSGAKPALHAFLDAHLEAGDLLVDIDAGDGAFTLDAACHPSGDVRVLALAPHPEDAAVLTDSLAIAGVDDMVEVVAAAAGDRSANALVSRKPRPSGHRVFALPEWVPGGLPVTGLDELLAERPDIADRRQVLRLGQAGWEADIFDGLWEALAMGRIAVAVWEHREGSAAADIVANSGYGLWRLPGDAAAGRPIPFDGLPGPVLALAPGVQPADSYGDIEDLPPLPADIEAAAARARALAGEGIGHHRAGRLAEAARLYGQALQHDPFSLDANANLGVLLRMNGRVTAAAACYRRALARGPVAGVYSNLGNALRELGRLAEADAAHAAALAAEPRNLEFIYNMALVRRDQGREAEATAMLEQVRAQRLHAGTIDEDMALARFRAGDLDRGFALLAGRRRSSAGYGDIAAWDGGDLDGRSILIHHDGEDADALLLARFIPLAAHRGGLVTVQCHPQLAPLMATLPGVEEVVSEIPAGNIDLHAAMLDLPRLLGIATTAMPRTVPYLDLPAGVEPASFVDDGRLRIGLAWDHRGCPFDRMLALAAHPDSALVGLCGGAEIAAAGAMPFVDDMGSTAADLGTLAGVIAGLDLVVGTDVAALHLAGALGRQAWALIPAAASWRWPDGRDDTPWYPTIRVFRQYPDGSWDAALARMVRALATVAAGRRW